MSRVFKKNPKLMCFRKEDRLLLFTRLGDTPLYVPYGAEYVLDILNEIDRLGNTVELLEMYPEDSELLDLLVERNAVVPLDQLTNYEEPARLSAGPRSVLTNEGDVGSSGIPNELHLYLLLAQFCNQRCIYCLNGDATYGKADCRRMDFDTARRAIDFFAARVSKPGRLNIIFFGGEPLLNWSLAKQVISYTQEVIRSAFPEIELRYHFTTNLTLFPKELPQLALQHRITFLVNVDGPQEIHDRTRPLSRGGSSFAKTAANLAKLNTEGIQFALRATVTSFNQYLLLETAELHREFGAVSCAMIPVNPVTSDEHVLPKSFLPEPHVVAKSMGQVISNGTWDWQHFHFASQFGQRLRTMECIRWPCGALLGSTPVVDVDGNIYPCIYLVGMARFKAGNISWAQDSFPSSQVIAMMRSLVETDLREKCPGCALNEICAGGCPVGTFLVKGNKAADENTIAYCREMACAMNRTMVEEVLWKLGEAEWASQCCIGEDGYAD